MGVFLQVGLLEANLLVRLLQSVVYTDMRIVDGLKETFEEAWLPEILVVYLSN